MTTALLRRAGVLTAVAAATTALAGCAGALGARMTYEDTEKAKITDIVLSGGDGDVTIRTAAVTETTIKRVVQRSSNPADSYRVTGSTLTLDTSCGPDCSVSYDIQAPAGVAVRGQLRSGDVHLADVGATDLEVNSGDLTVSDATGPVRLRTTSGDVRVVGAKSRVTVQATSGDIEATNAGGPLDLRVTSGDITAKLVTAASVTAQATSGDVNITVPDGSYRIATITGSGHANVSGLHSDPAAKNVIDVRTGSGDVTVGTA